MASKAKITLITPDEVVKSRRGRTAKLDSELVDILSTIEPGMVGVMDNFGPVTDKDKRGTIAADIRKHWREVHTSKPQIDWNPVTNLAQVQHKVEK